MNSLPNIYIRSLQNAFRRAPIRVGIVLDGVILPYGSATAVARLRVYDVIEMFADEVMDLIVELYVPWQHYDVVLFEKTFTTKALTLAHRLKKKGVKVILDVNVDYFSTTTPRVNDVLKNRAYDFSKMADAIIVPSKRLAEELSERHVHSRIEYIPEPLSERYLMQEKISFSQIPKLVWCGYHGKAKELVSITEQLRWAQGTYGATITLISDRDPRLTTFPYEFIRYQERRIPRDLAQRDVFVAPRHFDQSFKYHHTFTKIGLPMAVGLPVAASPMPSYQSSPAILCYTPNDWHTFFMNLYTGKLDLPSLSEQGRQYCRKEFSWERVRHYYYKLFYSLLSEGV